tara:strand:- start:103 stop:435 length:333 start_codon:yes stop_codon:yes gene_type:complete
MSSHKYTNRDSIKNKIREITISTYKEYTGTADFTEALKNYWDPPDGPVGTEEGLFYGSMQIDYFEDIEEEFELDIKLIDEAYLHDIWHSDKDVDQRFEDFVDFICNKLNI